MDCHVRCLRTFLAMTGTVSPPPPFPSSPLSSLLFSPLRAVNLTGLSVAPYIYPHGNPVVQFIAQRATNTRHCEGAYAPVAIHTYSRLSRLNQTGQITGATCQPSVIARHSFTPSLQRWLQSSRPRQSRKEEPLSAANRMDCHASLRFARNDGDVLTRQAMTHHHKLHIFVIAKSEIPDR